MDTIRLASCRRRLTNSTLLALAEVLLLGVPVKRDHQAERSPPPPLVARNDTHTTSPHPHPPDRLRRGPVRVHPRKDQRRWGQSYLRGLLLDGKRKSIQPIAARLAKGDPAAD